MGKKNRGYVSPEMDVILLERGDEVCTFSRACVSTPDGIILSDSEIGCWDCPKDDCNAYGWGGD